MHLLFKCKREINFKNHHNIKATLPLLFHCSNQIQIHNDPGRECPLWFLCLRGEEQQPSKRFLWNTDKKTIKVSSYLQGGTVWYADHGRTHTSTSPSSAAKQRQQRFNKQWLTDIFSFSFNLPSVIYSIIVNAITIWHTLTTCTGVYNILSKCVDL